MQTIDTVLFIPTEKELGKIFKTESCPFSDKFKAGFYQNVPIIVTGIGKTNAAITATLFFSLYHPKKTALIGICGAYRRSGLKVGETVSIKYDYFTDECVYDGKKIVTLAEKSMPPFENNRAEFEVCSNFKETISNTVSFISAEEKISELYRQKTNADTENMEGAAFGAAAARRGVKTYQIRTVSNFSGKLEKQEWNIDKAASNLKKAIDIFLNK